MEAVQWGVQIVCVMAINHRYQTALLSHLMLTWCFMMVVMTMMVCCCYASFSVKFICTRTVNRQSHELTMNLSDATDHVSPQLTIPQSNVFPLDCHQHHWSALIYPTIAWEIPNDSRRQDVNQSSTKVCWLVWSMVRIRSTPYRITFYTYLNPLVAH